MVDATDPMIVDHEGPVEAEIPRPMDVDSPPLVPKGTTVSATASGTGATVTRSSRPHETRSIRRRI